MDIAKIRKKLKGNDLSIHDSETKELVDEGELARKPAGTAQKPSETTVVPEPSPAIVTSDLTIELLTFSLAKEDYAFRIQEMQEILKPQRITKIPKTESYLIGITSLRGKIIPVIDLKARLALGDGTEQNNKQRILILKGRKGPIGAVVDRIIGVMRLPESKLEETPSHLLEGEMRFIDSVALVDGRFISIIKTDEAMDYTVGGS